MCPKCIRSKQTALGLGARQGPPSAGNTDHLSAAAPSLCPSAPPLPPHRAALLYYVLGVPSALAVAETEDSVGRMRPGAEWRRGAGVCPAPAGVRE